MKLPHQPITALLVLGFVSLVLNGCSTVQQQQAATMGGMQGAATGAVIGSQSNNTVKGAVIGGVIGAATAAVLAGPQAGSQPIQMQDNN